MKRCPKCNRAEPDDSLAFCRTDGTRLVGDGSFVSESAGTLRFDSAPATGEPDTHILPTGEGLSRPTAPTTVLDERQANGGTQELGRPKPHRTIVIAAAVVVTIVLTTSAYFYFSRVKNDRAIESIAVLPFVNEGGNADTEYLSDGMTESLIGSLSQIPKLNVKARSSVFRYKGKDTNAQTIGKELNVQAVLNGRVVQRGQDLTLYVELVDATTENSLWKQTYNKAMTNLVALQNDIARDVADKLKVKLSGADEQRLAKSDTGNAEAYQLYLKGRFHWNRRSRKDNEKALEYFQQAIAIDPNFALAYVGIAEAYMTYQTPESKARENAQKALSLDDNSAEAHTAFGRVLSGYDYDLAAAEREYRRAVELNPNYANAHYWYGQLCMAQGRWEEAFAAFRLALELEPLSLNINANYGGLLKNARRYDEAVAHLKKTLELDENFAPTYGQLAQAYWLKGNYAESVEALARTREIDGEHEVASLMRESFAKGGWEGFLRYMTEDRRAPWLSFNLATYHAALGEKDKAFAALNKAYENREAFLVLLKVDPRLDPLRDDPRFSELLRKVGLPQ